MAKEVLVLEEVTAQVWLDQLKNGEVGMQSASKNMIYIYQAGEILRNWEPCVSTMSEEEWLSTMDDGYRTFYILKNQRNQSGV